MMEVYRTVLSTPRYPVRINLSTPTISIGSCFAEHIGAKLKRNKFNLLLNPYGIIYNPVSIAQCLQSGLDEHKPEFQLARFGGLWHSLDHHSSFSAVDKKDILTNLHSAHNKLHQFLQQVEVLICTFGTAYAYHYRKSNTAVSNCHKIPASEFEKKFYDSSQLEEILIPLFKRLKQINVDVKIVLSVSPIRHLRDGLVENQLSKSTLITCCHSLCKNLSFCHYFPAYEWMMDDLRDYRFYQPDMIHPNSMAIRYIWEHFKTSLVDESCYSFLSKLARLHRSLDHRPLFPQSESYQVFLAELKGQLDSLQEEYPDLDFSDEKQRWQEMASTL